MFSLGMNICKNTFCCLWVNYDTYSTKNAIFNLSLSIYDRILCVHTSCKLAQHLTLLIAWTWECNAIQVTLHVTMWNLMQDYLIIRSQVTDSPAATLKSSKAEWDTLQSLNPIHLSRNRSITTLTTPIYSCLQEIINFCHFCRWHFIRCTFFFLSEWLYRSYGRYIPV